MQSVPKRYHANGRGCGFGADALQMEGSQVVVRDIAGARFVSRYHPRIVELIRVNGRRSTRTAPGTGLGSKPPG